MPICTTCTSPVPHLYTVYDSAYNIRLNQCSTCHAFADPYVEHDTLILVLDLILLKPGVFRHLLYNQGSKPRRITSSGRAEQKNGSPSSSGGERVKDDDWREADWESEREKRRWLLILRLCGAFVMVDADGRIIVGFIQLFCDPIFLIPTPDPHHPLDADTLTTETLVGFFRAFIGSLIETIAFHTGIMFSSFIVLTLLDWLQKWNPRRPAPMSGIRQEFRFSLIPLAIFYSSLTKLFLLFLLSIWRPDSNNTIVPARVRYASLWNGTLEKFIPRLLDIIDEDNLDREWIVRNLMGGMSTGFGLRVILDCHPVFATLIILAGWAVKTAIARQVCEWVGGDPDTGEAWLAYSIP